MTLVELLIVIVILTTLVGGVIPVLSPNNDTRKIRAAARGLQTYINSVQAEAARTGRPHGVGFRESTVGSGVALEVFGLEVPPLFAGFSTESRSPALHATEFWERFGGGGSLKYGKVPDGSHDQQEVLFPQFEGRDLYFLSFQLGNAPLNGINPQVPEWLPSRLLKNGDIVDIQGHLFFIVEHPAYYVYVRDPLDPQSRIDARNDYLDIPAFRGPLEGKLACILLNDGGQAIPSSPRAYKFRRRPTNTSDEPYQLPAGIVIDMQASVAEDSQNLNYALTPRFPTDISLQTNQAAVPEQNRAPNSLGVMFSPTGAVDSVIFNGQEMPSVSRLVLMLGRVENGGLDPDPASGEFPWVADKTVSKDDLEQIRDQINWLNTDSRLLSIVPNNGRIVVSQPAFVPDALIVRSHQDFPDNFNDRQLAELQIETAHSFAHEMTTVGGE